MSSDLPIALRPLGNYAAVQSSAFEDPGDEKSWHKSQRSESLNRFYEGRDPQWYASAIGPLAGADRVLDLGCGPGLTLRALLDQGAASVVGIDRWPFAAPLPGAPILVHDLTLPMPFIPSQSFDGVLSHYALDYLSPIGMRQVLREALRVLVPGGRLLIYVAGVGLGSGDETRTSPYSADAMTKLLVDAGFIDLDVESSPNGRNTVAKAHRPTELTPVEELDEPAVEVRGEGQLSAAVESHGEDRIRFLAADQTHRATLEIDLGEVTGRSRIGVCARVVALPGHGVELQAWVWRDLEPLAAESARLEFSPTSLSLEGRQGRLAYADGWLPTTLPLETAGSGYLPASDLRPAEELDEAARGAEGRMVVVETAESAAPGAEGIGFGGNRFFVRRPAASTTVAELDSQWKEGAILGIVLQAADLVSASPLCLWAGARGALLLIEGVGWAELSAALEERAEWLRGPTLMVDPALTGGPVQPVPTELAERVAVSRSGFLLLHPYTRDASPVSAQDLREAAAADRGRPGPDCSGGVALPDRAHPADAPPLRIGTLSQDLGRRPAIS